jgi:hypothetical protein
MPRKKDGMPFEVHPTPAKGRDGKNIVYAKPALRDKMTMSGVEDFCSRTMDCVTANCPEPSTCSSGQPVN